MHPLAILAVGVATVLGMILVLRINAFIALITAAIVVSLLSPGDTATKISRVAEAFGTTAGQIGIVIALAAVIGTCMMDSGAADRIVRGFLHLLGEKRAPFALMGSGFVLAVPVFFDTVFYLLVPLARSLHRRTGKNYLMYLVAIAAGGAITHTLVPPTPGPLVLAANLNIEIGVMILVGAVIALPAAICGVIFSIFIDRVMPVPMREVGGAPPPAPLPDSQLPPLFVSVLPVVLPVLMISANTIMGPLAKRDPDRWGEWAQITALIGNANLALLAATVVALSLYVRQRRPTLAQMSEMIEASLMSAGVIILITAGGGAFGAMLKVAEIGPAIEKLFSSSGTATPGMLLLFLGFGVAALLKVAQGSSTVSMITTSAMLAAMIGTDPQLGYHPVYLGTAIGSGSLIGSWMNDSGFWIFTKMGGLTEVESLKSWTILLILLGCVSMAMSVLLAIVLPLV